MQDVLVLILGGGRGARLFPLTKHRSEPAVPIAGKYRLIDIPISNCINSELHRIYVLTQYMSVSLHRHIANTYKFNQFSQGFVEVLAAQQTNERADWYRGTADAVRQNIRYVESDDGEDVLVLCGDQLYRTDFRKLVQTHRSTGADVTLSVLPVTEEQAVNYGVVKVDENKRITCLVEKPKTPEQFQELSTSTTWLQQQGFSIGQGNLLANMGMYLFRRKTLFDLLEKFPESHDFVTEILAESLTSHKIYAHLFPDYWEDVGSVKSYYEANIALASDHPPFDFHVPEGVIYTRMRDLPASRVLDAAVEHSLLSDGCLVEPGAEIVRSVLGVRSRVGRNVKMHDVVMMGANYYESESPPIDQVQGDRPPLGIGEGSVLEKVILDKNARIGRNVKILYRDNRPDTDADNYYIREGIVVVPDSAAIPDETVI